MITVLVTAVKSLCWLAILVSVAGLKSHTWYLLVVGGLGMFQNAVIAEISRDPATRNLPLTPKDIIMSKKLMDGLMDLEVTYPNSAQPLLEEYFPGLLRSEEDAWWRGERDTYDKLRSAESHWRGRPRSL